MWALIVGAVLPPFVSIVQQAHWPEWLRVVVGIVSSLIAATGTVLIQQGGWNWTDWTNTALLIIVTSIATYHGVWKKSGAAPAIERRTSAAPPAHSSHRSGAAHGHQRK